MNRGKYAFAQIFEFVSHNDFLKCVNWYNGDYMTKHFSCWKQFLCMAFDQYATGKVFRTRFSVCMPIRKNCINRISIYS